MSDVKADLAAEAVKIVTGARRSAYGKPEQNFERIARLWNAHLENTNRDLIHRRDREEPLDSRHTTRAVLTPADVATFCRFIKEARLAETPDHRDSFVDIIGYLLCQAELVLVADKGEVVPEQQYAYPAGVIRDGLKKDYAAQVAAGLVRTG